MAPYRRAACGGVTRVQVRAGPSFQGSQVCAVSEWKAHSLGPKAGFLVGGHRGEQVRGAGPVTSGAGQPRPLAPPACRLPSFSTAVARADQQAQAEPSLIQQGHHGDSPQWPFPGAQAHCRPVDFSCWPGKVPPSQGVGLGLPQALQGQCHVNETSRSARQPVGLCPCWLEPSEPPVLQGPGDRSTMQGCGQDPGWCQGRGRGQGVQDGSQAEGWTEGLRSPPPPASS